MFVAGYEAATTPPASMQPFHPIPDATDGSDLNPKLSPKLGDVLIDSPRRSPILESPRLGEDRFT